MPQTSATPAATDQQSADDLFRQSNLTTTQWTMWLGQQLSVDVPLYNMALLFEIHGSVNPIVFQSAFQELIRQSDNLRTVFDETNGVVRQRIQENIDYTLEIEDLQHLNEDEFLEWALHRTQQLFDLSSRVFDSSLIHRGPDRVLWYLNIHHLVTDAASSEILFRRLSTIYQSLLNGSPVEPPETASYPEYIQHERESRGDLPPPQMNPQSERLSLFGRPANRHDAKSAIREQSLAPGRSAAFNTVAGRIDPAAFTPALSRMKAWATVLLVWLFRVSGRHEQRLGVPLHNRQLARFRETSGLFLDMLPVSVTLKDDDTFRSVMARVSLQVSDVLLNRNADRHVVTASQLEVLLNVVRAEFPSFDGLPVTTRWLQPGYADLQHALRLNVFAFDGDGDISLTIEMNREAFGDLGCEISAAQLVTLIDAFTDDPEQSIASVDICGDVAAQSLAPLSPEFSGHTIVSRFEQQARELQDSTAVSCGAESVTWKQLDERADRVAQLLIQRGLKHGHRVAVLLNRSVDQIVGILGILKAGGCYVPLDPSYPENRIHYMLEDAECSIVLCHSDGQHQLPASCPPILLDDSSLFADLAAIDLPSNIAEDDTAYVIYTSGTTGRPKGVQIAHRNVLNLVASLRKHIYDRYENALNVALLAPIVFDASVQQIFCSLLLGHRLHIAEHRARRDSEQLLQFFRDAEIDVSDGTPAHLQLLASTPAVVGERLPRHLLIGGEQLTRSTLDAFYDRFQRNIRITNVYGVAECCVDTVAGDVTRESYSQYADAIPLGTALPGSMISVVNPAGCRQPPGVPGEIIIGGRGVGRGYLNRDDLNAERFITDPDNSGEQLYRTGDLGRYLDDGRIEYIGRMDRQVNLHGHRIELGEIEHQLREFGRSLNPDNDRTVDQTTVRCTQCLLTSRHPQVTFDNEGVCSVCREFEQYRTASSNWFGETAGFSDLLRQARSENNDSEYDCMLLYSGGKDSSYVLYRLVEMGLKVLAFTFDNGFISESAFRNIRRQTERLGVDLVIRQADRMNDIFVESLKDDHTVCSGCFRALTTISMRLAADRRINMIVTGLSRGQIFDTKLVGQMRQGVLDTQDIDNNLVVFRKLFHANQDLTTELLGVDVSDVAVEHMHFVDFFRYDSTPVPQIRAYLEERDEFWRQPEDTGFCSSNCRMNDVGICVHQSVTGFHNYEAPLSWDIRLGISTRLETLPEVTQPVDTRPVLKILNNIGFLESTIRDVRVLVCDSNTQHAHLAAWYTAETELASAQLRSHLSRSLPPYMIPSQFIRVAKMPLTVNGKIDDGALRGISPSQSATVTYVAAVTPIQKQMTGIWQTALGREQIGITDNFFELGGDSITAIQIVAGARRIGIHVTPTQVFRLLTIEDLSRHVKRASSDFSAMSAGPVRLTPIQKRYLNRHLPAPDAYAQTLLMTCSAPIDIPILNQCLNQLVQHHRALGLQFHCGPNGWKSVCPKEIHERSVSDIIELAVTDKDQRQLLSELELTLLHRLNLKAGNLLEAAVIHSDAGSDQILMVIHHLVVDAVSWSFILRDLDHLYSQAVQHMAQPDRSLLPVTTTSVQHWAKLLETDEMRERCVAEMDWWKTIHALPAAQLPSDFDEAVPSPNSTESVRSELGEGLTSVFLQTSGEQDRLRPQAVLATAMAVTIADWTKSDYVRIDVEGHGRDSLETDADLSGTVGWFTSIYPIGVDTSNRHNARSTLAAVCRQLWETPNNGSLYGLCRELAPDNGTIWNPAPVLLNYLGRATQFNTDGKLVREHGPLGVLRSAENPLEYLLAVDAIVSDEVLIIDWTFSPSVHRRATVDYLADRLLQTIRILVKGADANVAPPKVAADFPLAQLSSGKLNKLAAMLSHADSQDQTTS